MRTLITYATKYGCTEKCAKALAEKFSGQVDLQDIKRANPEQISAYDKVVIGGSIYMGRISPLISKFCTQNRVELERKSLGLFICCLRDGELAEAELQQAFPEGLFSKAKAKEYFGGELTYKKMGLVDRLITKMVSKADENFPVFDADRNVSVLKTEKIERFAQIMNKV